MYYSSGNYEAFARPLKPEGIDRKAAYLVGTGIASLSAACYLVRDGRPLTDGKLNWLERLAVDRAVGGLQANGLGKLLQEHHII